MMQKKIYSPKGKIIRDIVHGDIFIENKYLDIINTKEFQRLRRIKQLSVANLVFPSADHTRFSHSIGTFYIMKQIINHFENEFERMNISISDREKSVALVAALLHDVGHGPFSHAFEKINPRKENNISHEKWTEKIIREGDQLSTVLKSNFDDNFSEEVISLIKHQRHVKKSREQVVVKDFFSVLSSLISSQLDADRLDYLLRDTIHTGVSFGTIDLHRIISSLRISVIGDEYCVVIPEKYVPDIENYLLGRYQMYKGVYYHPFKVEMEIIIKKIFSRAYYLFNKNSINISHNSVKKIFSSENVTVDEYIELDDMILFSEFMKWSQQGDLILSLLCKSFSNRKKFNKVQILDGSSESILEFKKNLSKVFPKNISNHELIDNSFFWIQENIKFSLYKMIEENIWISLSDGTYEDISCVSKIINNQLKADAVVTHEMILTFFNYELFLEEYGIDNSKENEILFSNLIDMYDSRNHVEIEKKYHFNNEAVFSQIRNKIEKTEYYIGESNFINQIDYYYDTPDKIVESKMSTLRIRKNEDGLKLTIKKPTILAKDKLDTQNIRFEHEIPIDKLNIYDYSDYICDHLELTKEDIDLLSKSLTVRNSREHFMLTNMDIEFEVAFDKVTYQSTSNKEYSENQLEIELKSDYSHKVNLKILTDQIENCIQEINVSKESKYNRGIRLTEEIT